MKSYNFKLILLVLFLVEGCYTTFAQGVISGEPSPVLNSTHQYSYTHNSITTSATWSVSKGTKVSQWTSTDKLTAYANIKWTSSGTGSITLKIGTTTIANKTVSISSTAPPACSISPPSYTVSEGTSSCGASEFHINATPGSGGSKVRWYATETGWAYFHEGTSYTTPVLSATTTYYISSINGDEAPSFAATASASAVSSTFCQSNRRAVTLEVHPVVSSPSVSAPPVNCQGPASVTITGTAGANGSTIQWFSSSTSTTVLETNLSYTTPSLSASATYYARSYNTATGCYSARVPVTATVYVTPTLPTASGKVIQSPQQVTIDAQPGANADQVQWYSTLSGGSPFHTGTSYTTPVLSATTTYHLTSRKISADCETASRLPVTITYSPPLQLFGETNVNTTDNYTYIFDEYVISNYYWAVTNGTIVNTTENGFTYQAVVKWTTNGSGQLVLKQKPVIGNFVYAIKDVTISCTPPGPPSSTIYHITDGVNIPGSSSCGPSAFKINASAGINGKAVRWYTASTGGTHFLQGASYTTPVLSASTTYYLTSYHTISGCESSSRQAVTVTVNAVPPLPSVNLAQRCGTGSVTLTGSTTSGNTIQWFDSPTALTPVYTNPANFPTPSISVTTTYYARSFNTTTGCFSARVPVNAIINPLPAQPTGGYDDIVYGAGQLSITVQPGANGNTVRWYVDESASVHQWQDTQILTPVLNQSTTYFITSYNTITTCESQVRIPVPVMIIPYISPSSLKKEIVRVPNKKNPEDLLTLTPDKKTTVVSYFDGLMRTHQSVVVKGSPLGKDIVNPVEFDSHGRTSKSFLPYVSTTTDGSLHAAYATQQLAFYNNSSDKVADDANPFAVSVYESSPLGRVLEQGSIGSAWQPGTGHTQRLKYTYNTTNEVRQFNSDGTSAQFYPANTLMKIESTDADGNKQIAFQDKAGKTLLKKQQLDEVIDGATVDYLEIYYVYDDFGRIRYTISPKGVAALKNGAWAFLQSIKDQYVYEFVYDKRGRVVEKKVPGQAWTFYAYDKFDRPVLSQDGLLRAANKWMFVKYDRKGRTVMQGLYYDASNTTRVSIQGLLDGLYTSTNSTYPESAWHESRGSVLHGHTNNSFPKTNADTSPLEVLAVNFYDHHDFDDPDATGDFSYVAQGLTGENLPARPYLLPTGSKTLILGTTTWLYTYVFYDKYGRAIQMRSNNHLSTTIDNLVTSVYDFEGKILTTKNYHNAGSGRTTTVINKYTYDNQGRLLKIYQNNNGAPSDQLVAQYEYNELGQVVDKKLHNTTGNDFMQSVDYRFNIRGQLASINNAQQIVDSSNDDNNDYFGMELVYNTAESGLSNTQYFNGNISAMKWKGPGTTSGATDQRSYKFTYDKANRLETAVSQMNSGSAWNKETNAVNETMSYDHNGNIQTLQRNQRQHQLSGVIASYASQQIDNLTYTYETAMGDRLKKVEDASAQIAGFNNASNVATEYNYDINGNVTEDKNKGISSISYNFLGKPTVINFTDGRKIEYTYDAGGSKLTMKNFTGSTLVSTTDYAGSFIYENGNLAFFGSPEGRVVKKGSELQYEYAISDHQGNTRLVFTSATPVVQNPSTGFESNPGTLQNFPTGGNLSQLPLFNQTPGGTKSQHLNGGNNSQVGVGKSFAVYPGDKVKIRAYAKYESGGSSTSFGFATALLGAFSLNVPAVGETGTASSALKTWGGLIDGGVQSGGTAPQAFVNIVVFDKNYNFLDAAWDQISESAVQVGVTPDVNHDEMLKEYTITEAGFVYLYVSNNSPVKVYFDDVEITHTPTNIVQYNEYYPFGLQASTSWTRENNSNNFLYNAGNELNKNSGWYEMFYRGYDPALGRMMQVDPYATSYASHSPYNYALNSPSVLNDPSGGYTPLANNFGRENVDRAYSNGWAMDFSSGYGGGGGGSYTERMHQERIRDQQLLDAARNGDQLALGELGAFSLSSNSFGDIAGAFNNGGAISLNDDLINLFYCDCNAQVAVSSYGGDPIEMPDGGNIVRGFNNIFDVEFEFTRTGVGRSEGWESIAPVWASGRNAIDDFHYGDYWRGVGNTALAISDLFLVRAIGSALLKAGAKFATLQFTKSSLKLGQQMHTAYKLGLADNISTFKEFRLPSGRRIDFLDVKSGIIFELKPFNPNAMKAGQRQLGVYMQELKSMPHFQGIRWRTVLDTY